MRFGVTFGKFYMRAGGSFMRAHAFTVEMTARDHTALGLDREYTRSRVVRELLHAR